MDPSNVLPLVELLDESLDTLTEAATGLSDGIHDMASKLPLLDKAKLYVLMTYAVESILFCEIGPYSDSDADDSHDAHIRETNIPELTRSHSDPSSEWSGREGARCL